MLNISIYLLLGILVMTSVLMVLIVLMQRPKNEGLGASFGGGMTQDLFGAQTTNVLQKFTVYLGAVFFASCLFLAVLYSRKSTATSEVQKNLSTSAAIIKTKPVVPASTPTSDSSAVSTPSTTQTPVTQPETATVPFANIAEPSPATDFSPSTMSSDVAVPSIMTVTPQPTPTP